MSLGVGAAESRRNPVVQSLEAAIWKEATITSRSNGKKWVYGRAGQRPHVAWERVSLAPLRVYQERLMTRVAFGYGVRTLTSRSGNWKAGGKREVRGKASTETKGPGPDSIYPPRLLGALSSGKGRSVCMGGGQGRRRRVLPKPD